MTSLNTGAMMIPRMTTKAIMGVLAAVAIAWLGMSVGSAVDHKDHKEHKANDDPKHAHPGDPI